MPCCSKICKAGWQNVITDSIRLKKIYKSFSGHFFEKQMRQAGFFFFFFISKKIDEATLFFFLFCPINHIGQFTWKYFAEL